MRKKIKMWGKSAVIVLTKEDLEGYGVNPGDFINFEFINQEILDERMKKIVE